MHRWACDADALLLSSHPYTHNMHCPIFHSCDDSPLSCVHHAFVESHARILVYANTLKHELICIRIRITCEAISRRSVRSAEECLMCKAMRGDEYKSP